MADYTKLRDFAERIKAKGIPEQQYIAEGILGLLSEAVVNKDAAERKSENESNTSSVSQGLTPSPPGEGFKREEPVREGLDREDLSGCIVEEANGDRWIVEGWVYEAKSVFEDEYIKCGLMPIRRTFSQEELEAGLFNVVGKGEV